MSDSNDGSERPGAREMLLGKLIDEAASNGLGERSLRDLATAVGSSHRMLNYHFGSRAGLVSAIVQATEAAQRDALDELATHTANAGELIMALWAQVSSEEMRPFVRLFFECLAATGGVGLTDPWLDRSSSVASAIGSTADDDLLRLGVAVSRGLLIDVLATGDATEATKSMERFVELTASSW